MIIITYSETNAETIEQRLGKAEYSYYFIYKKYLPAMERLGRLVSVSDPATEVDKIYRENPDDACIFLSFSPPHRTLLELECPTVCVFAWEFSTIPEEAWHGHPEYNWAEVFRKIGNAVTISRYAANVVSKAVPEGLNIEVIPAAIDTVPVESLKPAQQGVEIAVNAKLYDNRFYAAFDAGNRADDSSIQDGSTAKPWTGEPVRVTFTQDDPEAYELLVGFYDSEPWGTWSRIKSPWIMLPYSITGPVVIDLEMVAYGNNIDSDISVQLGSEEQLLRAGGLPGAYTLSFDCESPATTLRFHDLNLTHAPGARDHRSLGIGLKSLSIRRPDDYVPRRVHPAVEAVAQLFTCLKDKLISKSVKADGILQLKGVVYSTVMNPEDGRKNWEDMITAFCWAFREQEDATLILKMTHHKATSFVGKLLSLFSQMGTFKCRVIAVHGFLTDEQYQALIDNTHYVVNSSHCEGQCLPLMEFMAQGVPAIAPDHTAMADYVTAENAFVIKSSLYPTCWPIDARNAIRTLCYRIDWNSLKDAYLKSHEIVNVQPDEYEKMRVNAVQSIEQSAGQNVVYEKMKIYFAETARKASDGESASVTSQQRH